MVFKASACQLDSFLYGFKLMWIHMYLVAELMCIDVNVELLERGCLHFFHNFLQSQCLVPFVGHGSTRDIG